MARFWTYIKKADFNGLTMIPLAAFNAFELTGNPDSPVMVSRHHGDDTRVVILRETSESGDDTFILIIRPPAKQEVRVNGEPVFAGIKKLRDRDEILVFCAGYGYQRLLFSSEKKAKIERLDSDQPCVRCKHIILSGDYAVRCPGCGLYHHQSELNCWSYSSKCGNSVCTQRTDLAEDFRWIPEYIAERKG